MTYQLQWYNEKKNRWYTNTYKNEVTARNRYNWLWCHGIHVKWVEAVKG